MILTLSGASGTGKTTIEKALIERLPNAQPLVSVTTRNPRPSDLPGDFLHVSQETFARMETRGEFLWTNNLGDARYGTRRQDLQHALTHPETIWIMVLVPRVVGNLLNAARNEPGTHEIRSFYILNPSPDILRARLAERGDHEADIQSRMEKYADFQQKARTSGVPFIEIQDNNDLEEKIQGVVQRITKKDEYA